MFWSVLRRIRQLACVLFGVAAAFCFLAAYSIYRESERFREQFGSGALATNTNAAWVPLARLATRS
jgi:hypothetical protein